MNNTKVGYKKDLKFLGGGRENECPGHHCVVIGLGIKCVHNYCIVIGSDINTESDYQLIVGNSKVRITREMTDKEYQEICDTLKEILSSK